MFSIILFISGGEIFVILVFVLIFFGADKIPEFMRFMGKGVSEFKKATDDIKREFQDSSSGMFNEIKSISNDLNDRLKKEIAEPMQKSINETSKTFEEYQEQYNTDYYYNNQNYIGSYGNEFQNESSNNSSGHAEEAHNDATQSNAPTDSSPADQANTNEIET